jgi:hypothetical protein
MIMTRLYMLVIVKVSKMNTGKYGFLTRNLCRFNGGNQGSKGLSNYFRESKKRGQNKKQSIGNCSLVDIPHHKAKKEPIKPPLSRRSLHENSKFQK